eukprot:gene5835-37465_t
MAMDRANISAASIIRSTDHAPPPRRGAREGDWAIVGLVDDPALGHEAVTRIRAAAHSTILITQSWSHRVRVRGSPPLCASLWGGQELAALEVTPPGCTQADAYAIRPGHWVANIGKYDAYIQLMPHGSGSKREARDREHYLLRLPPQTKAVLLVHSRPRIAAHHTDPRLTARRYTREVWVKEDVMCKDGRTARVCRPNSFSTTLVWHAPAAEPEEGPPPSNPQAVPTHTRHIHLRRIDHILLSRVAEQIEHTAAVIWDPHIIVDHAAIEFRPLREQESGSARPFRWRCTNYNPKTDSEKMEWVNAMWLFTRNVTAADTTGRMDELATAAAHAALSRDQSHRTVANPAGAQTPDTRDMNAAVEWTQARIRDQPMADLRIDSITLRTTEDHRTDAARGAAAIRIMRRNARREEREKIQERISKRKEWEAECSPADPHTTKRLMRKTSAPPIAVVEREDGTLCAGDLLADEVWEQSRGRRRDAYRRAKALEFIRDYPHDRLGEPITADQAAECLWGLKASAPSTDQISAPMMRLIAAWEPDIWMQWV